MKSQIKMELYNSSDYHPFARTVGFINISKKLADQHTKAIEIKNAIEDYIKWKHKREQKREVSDDE